jgi:hypothetical protein
MLDLHSSTSTLHHSLAVARHPSPPLACPWRAPVLIQGSPQGRTTDFLAPSPPLPLACQAMRQARSAHSVVGISRCCRQKTFFLPAAREEEKTNLRHHRTKSPSAGSRKQTKAAAADDIPAGHLASSHAMRRLWLFTARSACCPARLPVGDLTAAHESPKTWPARHRLCRLHPSLAVWLSQCPEAIADSCSRIHYSGLGELPWAWEAALLPCIERARP